MPAIASGCVLRAVTRRSCRGLALLLAMTWALGAAGQSFVVVPLVNEADESRYVISTRLDTLQRPRAVPKGLRRYLLKYVVFGGEPGQPPAQRVNFLIGRDAAGRVVFVPAVGPQSLVFRVQDQQVLPAAPGRAPPVPFRVTLRGTRGPLVLELLPVVYPQNFRYATAREQELFLQLERKGSRTSGTLPMGPARIALRATHPGFNQMLIYTDSITQVSVLDGKHEREIYRMGDSFLANGHLVRLQHISPAGDSLRVQLTGPERSPSAYGNYAGLLFRPVDLTDVQGQRVRLTGTERPLVLDFWGTWCGPCVALTPALQALHRQYAATTDVVGVAYDDPNKVKKYLATHAITWPNVVVPDTQPRSLITQLGISAYPTYMLIHKGKILYRGVGASGLQELTQRLAQLP